MTSTISASEIKSNVEKLELYSDSYPFSLPLRISTFENETEYTKFVKNCEKIVRGSLEYKLWRKYIIDVLGVNECMMTHESGVECTIEVHHHVPSLFILIKSLINKKIEENSEFSTFDIALETIELHFLNKIGYLVLIESMHEKFHNGFLKVPFEFIKGDYRFFLENYSKYLDTDDLDVLNERLAYSLKDNPDFKYNWGKDEYPAMAAKG